MILHMGSPPERILIVENDPDTSEQMARQMLIPAGYQVSVVNTGPAAIQEAASSSPDLILADLDLPGLSGKDLLVGLISQGLEAPVIVIARERMERNILQAFRLGAQDFLLWPASEAELISVVDRVLRQVRVRRERELLARQLNKTNQELQRRVRELTTIFAIGKAVTSITNQQELFEKIVEGAIYVSEAECGWLLLRQGSGKTFVLKAQRNLPQPAARRLNQPWEDGIAPLVGLSGETLSIHGVPLKRFKISEFGQSALVVPIKVKNEVVGLLTVLKKDPQPFSASNQTLLEAVADYSSISMMNTGLFRILEERARSLQMASEAARASEQNKDEILKKIWQELYPPLEEANEILLILIAAEEDPLNARQKQMLASAQERLETISLSLETLARKGR